MSSGIGSELTAPALGLMLPNGPVFQSVQASGNHTVVLDKACTWIYAQVLQKHFTPGNGSVAPTFALEAASDANFTFGDVAQLALESTQRATGPASVLLMGFCGTGPKKNIRVKMTLSGTDTLVYESRIWGIG